MSEKANSMPESFPNASRGIETAILIKENDRESREKDKSVKLLLKDWLLPILLF
jgi:hypothetical protein